MSDIAMSQTAHKSYHLSLGHGDRSITDQGDGAETVNSGVVASPGARRSIVFPSCKLRGDIEIDGRKVSEASHRRAGLRAITGSTTVGGAVEDRRDRRKSH
jgi:hypothetical protein